MANEQVTIDGYDREFDLLARASRGIVCPEEYHADKFIKYVKSRGCPTQGNLAYAIWLALSGNNPMFPAKEAIEVYKKLGYYAFSGYPLNRKR